MKKAKHFYELAAMNGNVKASVYARYNLGVTEYETGNHHRAMKHLILSSHIFYNP